MVGLAPPAKAAAGLRLTTPFPAVTSSPDNRVSFDLTVDANEAGRIDLEVTRVPASWTATLHGGGLVVGAVLLDGSDPAEVRLDVDVPADATGTTRIVVVASDNESRVELPLDVTVEAEAVGEVTVDADFPALRGAAGTTFTFNLTVNNDKAEDLTYTATGQGPPGWSVQVTPTGQSQAVSATVTAGAEAGLTVTVDPPEGAPAGVNDVLVVATVGSDQIEVPLQVEITGSYELDVSTPNQNLSVRGPSGGVTEQRLSVINTGSAPVTNVTLSASPPTGWEVTFEPETIAAIPPDEPVEVVARITPAGDAIAGDYSLTVSANGEEADAEAELRFTVETSIIGGLLGGLLILGAVGGLIDVFRRYGRR
jgi:uncharacterized membrane protein